MPDSYHDHVWMAYHGELVGEHLYRRLAERAVDADSRSKLRAIADVEGLTHRRLCPIAIRLGIRVTESDWRQVVERRARELESLSWREFIGKAVVNWPPFIGRFEAMLPLTPEDDVRTIRQLVEHEVVLVEFARLEAATLSCNPARGDAQRAEDSLRVLRAFLDS